MTAEAQRMTVLGYLDCSAIMLSSSTYVLNIIVMAVTILLFYRGCRAYPA